MKPASLHGRIVCAAGLLLVLFLPYHLVLRRFTESSTIMAWKEAVQAVGLLAIPLFVAVPGRDPRWQRVAVFVLVTAALLMLRIDYDDPLYFVEGFLVLVGPACCGYWFYTEFNRFRATGEPSWALKAVLLASLLPSIWLCLEDHYSLSNYFTLDLDEDHFKRWNMTRAHAAFDSPMTAGQWLWMTGTLSLFFAVKSRKWSSFALYSGIFTANCFGVLFTGSRGPYVVVAISTTILLVLALRAKLPLKRKKLAAVAATMGVTLLAALIYLPLYQKEWFSRAITTVTDPEEQANQIRRERIEQGVEDSLNYWPNGRGLDSLSGKYLIYTGDNYENTYFALITSLGVLGAALSLAFLGTLGYTIVAGLARGLKQRDLNAGLIAAMAVPWLIYSFVFPIMSGRMTSVISWGLIGIGASILWREPGTAAVPRIESLTVLARPTRPLLGRRA